GVCDITASVSCTVVNSGIYYTIVGIQVAVYGVAWFLISGVLSWNSFKNRNVIPKLVGWNVAGLLFVFYFIYIEFLLSTICPFCTVVHVIIVISLVLSIVLYKQVGKTDN
ncbi:MAG: vitamin K epoxide reductase family protein, partial [Nanoarchaeota archaeon]|nr:vitamin K epoxide reductase family protein [Nanoarchaeota archaeon]